MELGDSLFPNDPLNAILIEKSIEERFQKIMENIENQLKEWSTEFPRRPYQGHMNYDVSAMHMAGLNMALPWNQNQVAAESSMSTTKMEVEIISDLCEFVGYGSGGWGYVSTGGTISNMEGLWIAREKGKKYNRSVVLASEHAHYSIEKSCRILNLELKRFTDTSFPTAEELARSNVCAIVVTAGTTEFGKVEDIPTIIKIVREAEKISGISIYVHADAAWGGYFLFAKDDLSEETKNRLVAIKDCDSITLDPHKAGFAPYCCGCFLLKNGQDRKFIDCTSNVSYIDSSVSSAFTIEGSRSGAAVCSLYAGQKGLEPLYGDLLSRCLRGARILQQKLETSGRFEVFSDTDLAITLFRYKDPSMMLYLQQRFCDLRNTREDRVQLVCTKINNNTDLYFRIVTLDPNFVDYVDSFIQDLHKDLDFYLNDFEQFVKNRVENLLKIAEECNEPNELYDLIRSCKIFTAYNGFEPSGRTHIAQAAVTVLNANTIIENGGRIVIYIADWFAKLNHKMGGDLEKIQEVGRYFIEVFKSLGIKTEATEFVWASEFIQSNPDFWPRVLDIATKTTLNRTKRCCQIMGRKDTDTLSSSQIFYPCMQCADIFTLRADICQLGMDQRKVNMLGREYAEKAGLKKPIILSHHMLMGLGPGNKMSKSDPKNAIFVEDSAEDVISKIRSAHCPQGSDQNPIFEYIRYILVPWFHEIILCGKKYQTVEDIEKDFEGMDKKTLKENVADYINQILQPVRDHFSKPGLKELAERVGGFRVTR